MPTAVTASGIERVTASDSASITASAIARQESSGRTLTDTALRLLEYLHPQIATSYDIQGAVQAAANEVDRLDNAVTALIGDADVPLSSRDAELFPIHSTALLSEWEQLLNIPVDSRKTVAQRRDVVATLLRTLKQSRSAKSWKTVLDDLIGTNWSYLLSGNALTLYLPYAGGLSNPATPTTTDRVSASGGTLPIATYYYAISAVNFYGETAVAYYPSLTTSVADRKITLSWTAVTGATEYRIYRSTNGTSDLRRLVGTETITGTSFADTGYANTGAFAPTTNTTSSALADEALRVARQITPAHISVAVGYTTGFLLDISKLDQGVVL